MTPVVMDMNADGVAEVVFVTYKRGVSSTNGVSIMSAAISKWRPSIPTRATHTSSCTIY